VRIGGGSMTRDELIKAARAFAKKVARKRGEDILIDFELMADFALSVSGWTATSDKLPNTRSSYFVTVQYPDGELDVCTAFFTQEFGWHADVTVLAWMPLPAPYEPQESK
jgi:hypothetical protein